MESVDSLPHLIGSRIAGRRSVLGFSLDEVAERAGVSRAMVSRIERGEVHASAVVLDRLCAGLGLTLSALFERPAAEPLARRADQPVWRDPETGYVRREVTPGGPHARLRLVEIEFPAGATVTFEPTPGRGFEQHVWVLEGTIEASWPGGTYRLETGDCLRMQVGAGNRFHNPTGQTARYAVVIARQDGP